VLITSLFSVEVESSPQSC